MLAWLREVLLIFGPLVGVILVALLLEDFLLESGVNGDRIALFLLIGIAIGVVNAWFWTLYFRRKAKRQNIDGRSA